MPPEIGGTNRLTLSSSYSIVVRVSPSRTKGRTGVRPWIPALARYFGPFRADPSSRGICRMFGVVKNRRRPSIVNVRSDAPSA